ncbi:MAG: FAD:protein FMN transferase [Deltaproteobacteria bacterium]|nr:FAD:protein FMN transferase [Deltaproteobacteria bacterium]
MGALLVLLVGADPVPPPASPARETRSAPLMGTVFDVSLPVGSSDAFEAVWAVFRDVDEQMNEWRAGSPLAELNRAAGKGAVAVPAELRALLRRSLELAALCDGAFEPTWAALWGLWDFKAKEPRLPDAAALAAATRLIDYRGLVVDDVKGTAHLTRAGMKVGLGGIAKGWALDRAADLLRKRGITSFLLSAGGQVYAGGSKGGVPWQVGVRDPRGGPDEFFAVLEVVDVSVSTSGDYERFFEQDGVRYHHILDPKTGMPSRGLRSATVIAHDATLADALSTALMVLGRDKGLALVERLPGVQALVVDDQGRIGTSSGLTTQLHVVRQPRP